MTRKYSLYIIIPILGFITFLGMRVPDISRPYTPKPRPRAILKNQVKASEEVCKIFAADADHAQAVLPVPLFRVGNVLPVDELPFVSIAAASPSSRGPPQGQLDASV